MLDILFNGVLPIFAVVALGFIVARFPIFDVAMATALNRYLFYIAGPPLIFRFIAAVRFDAFVWRAVIAYFLVELCLYGLSFLLFRRAFGRPPREALLLALAAIFPNHFFFVLPIATALFGEATSQPIVALIAIDSILVYGATMLILEVARSRGGGEVSTPEASMRVLKAILRNPQVLAIILALLVNFSGARIPSGIELYARFLGDSAAPCSLFALGIILTQRAPGLDLWVPVTVGSIKLAAMPVLVALALYFNGVVDPLWNKPILMVAGGPSGIMAFVLALHYGIPTAAITRAILITAICSVGVLTVLAAM